MTRSPQSHPHPVDRHVGHRIQARRKTCGLTQSQLADALGISMQQVQKYETAFNRISASRLYEISQVLAVPVGFFFEGLPPEPGDETLDHPQDDDPLFRPETVELLGLFVGQPMEVQSALLRLFHTMDPTRTGVSQ
ncbi:MAG: helix-turn-helix domain-containing protein [Rhodospirillum sp.]|nr:helix-turn-helix domain-containing protein [Rhodospirillum sp.]MCF8502103.1 helix-turn-helix domain-containing protein [Rhodospirillum sp.]